MGRGNNKGQRSVRNWDGRVAGCISTLSLRLQTVHKSIPCSLYDMKYDLTTQFCSLQFSYHIVEHPHPTPQDLVHGHPGVFASQIPLTLSPPACRPNHVSDIK